MGLHHGRPGGGAAPAARLRAARPRTPPAPTPDGPVVATGGAPGGLEVRPGPGFRPGGAPYPEGVDAPKTRYYTGYGLGFPYIMKRPLGADHGLRPQHRQRSSGRSRSASTRWRPNGRHGHRRAPRRPAHGYDRHLDRPAVRHRERRSRPRLRRRNRRRAVDRRPAARRRGAARDVRDQRPPVPGRLRDDRPDLGQGFARGRRRGRRPMASRTARAPTSCSRCPSARRPRPRPRNRGLVDAHAPCLPSHLHPHAGARRRRRGAARRRRRALAQASKRLKVGHTGITWGFKPTDAEQAIKDVGSLGYRRLRIVRQRPRVLGQAGRPEEAARRRAGAAAVGLLPGRPDGSRPSGRTRSPSWCAGAS